MANKNGKTDRFTRVTLKGPGTESELYTGCVLTGKKRPAGTEIGSPQWIDKIIVCAGEPNPDKTFQNTVDFAKSELQIASPETAVGTCDGGEKATVYVIEANQPLHPIKRFDVDTTFMQRDPGDTGLHPHVLEVTAWTDRSLMTAAEVAQFDKASAAACTAENVAWQPLKP